MSQWQIHLFGTLRAERGQEIVTRFRSQKYGVLLAYLALYPRRSQAREELADMLWPDAEVEAARGNVRAALASLRRQLEPPGSPAGSVLVADGRTHVRLNTDNVRTDVSEFEAALAAASHAETPDAVTGHLARAVQHYAGPLLPGTYEDWCLSERDRLGEAYLRALRQLSSLHEQAGDADQALDFARRAVSADPAREEAHATVIRLLMQTGQTGNARRQFDEMEQQLRDKLDLSPSPATRALLTLTATPSAPAAPRPRVSAPAPVAPTPAAVPDAPALATPLHLPATTTRFFGREDEINALRRLLTDAPSRLVTITGPGGGGKTRVATETVRELGTHFRGGIWFVGLEAVREADRLTDAVADAIALPKAPGQAAPVLPRVVAALQKATGSAPALLILDNFEQVAENGAPLLADLLEAVPGLSCLVTSRQRLRLEQEHEFPLLPLPTPAYPGLPDRLMEFSSVQLFVSRAQAAKADFQLNARNAASVAALCTKLEGIPLAIELAAAWAAMLTPHQTLQRMERRLDLLVSRRRDVSARHRTLRAAIESSVALLSAEVRHFFCLLSVFRGGWTLEAAEAVCQEPFALEYLTLLRDHSLIVGMDSIDENTQRYRMLETLREFASECLHAGETGACDAAGAKERHTRFFTGMVEEAIPQLAQTNQADWLRRLDADHDNMRATLERLDAENSLEDALSFAAKLTGFWNARGYLTEGRERLAPLLERAGTQVAPYVRAQALSGLGKMAYHQGDYAVARPSHEACLAIYRDEDHREGIARSLCELGNCEMLRSAYPEAGIFYEESLNVYKAIGDKRGTALLLNNMGVVSLAKGEPITALPYLEACLPLSRDLGHHRIVALALMNLASIWHDEGDLNRAHVYYEQCLAVRRELGDEAGVGRALEGLARLAMEQGDGDKALHYFDESLTLLRKIQRKEGIASASLYRGLTLISFQNDLPGGIASLTESLTVSRDIGNKHFASYAFNAFATVAAREQQWERAVKLWAAADAQFVRLGVTLRAKAARELEAEINRARVRLSQSDFDRAWEAGGALSLDAATTFALQDNELLLLAPKLLAAVR